MSVVCKLNVAWIFRTKETKGIEKQKSFRWPWLRFRKPASNVEGQFSSSMQIWQRFGRECKSLQRNRVEKHAIGQVRAFVVVVVIVVDLFLVSKVR